VASVRLRGKGRGFLLVLIAVFLLIMGVFWWAFSTVVQWVGSVWGVTVPLFVILALFILVFFFLPRG